MPIKIISVKKSNSNHQNPYMTISHLNWIDEYSGEQGIHTRLEVYYWVKYEGIAYIEDNSGNVTQLSL